MKPDDPTSFGTLDFYRGLTPRRRVVVIADDPSINVDDISTARGDGFELTNCTARRVNGEIVIEGDSP